MLSCILSLSQAAEQIIQRFPIFYPGQIFEGMIRHETLAEGEGSVQLTSLY